jgi:hypothetical protein
MAKKRSTLIRRERVIRDGVPYTVSVYAERDQYEAHWLCGACSTRSAVIFLGKTPDEAIRGATADLTYHQTMNHTRSR